MKLSTSSLGKGTFVFVETRNKCYEIGIVRESELRINDKKLQILILTDADFKTSLPPIFDEDWPPFLPNGTREVDLNAHTVYSIEPQEVLDLLAQQKKFLKERLPEKQAELDAFENFEEELMTVCL